jgi:DNA replication ATP-dependent helicase Dna2
VANHFLDSLLQNPEGDFQTLFRETFALYPLMYAPLDDETVRSLSSKARSHFNTLQQMAREGFARQQIKTGEAVLEPSFFSAQYGLQGRLDLFHINEERASIVELKSGKPFKPNGFGISRNHFTQALLYDLLTRSVYKGLGQSAKYILYSGADDNPLRFAPTVEAEQWEAIQVRNQLVSIERLLTTIMPGQKESPVFSKLNGASFVGKGFIARDMSRFEAAYLGLSPLERAYMQAFTGFIAREHWLARCGVEGSEQIMGQAARWRQLPADKEQSFSILQGLKLVSNNAGGADPELHFLRGPDTNPLANFRTGDIAVLYPMRHPEDNVLQHQVIKCSITHIDKQGVTVALRYRQSNPRPFAHEGCWALEPDLLDNGFVSQYRSLFEWMEAPPDVRARVMDPAGWPTETGEPVRSEVPVDLTAEQGGLLQKMTGQRGYFLLWGPPGTGKTSVMLRSYVQWVLRHTADNMLLMAYTNRAVDEMCEALESIGPELRQQYWRIGSRYSTDERFREQLLQRHLSGARSRADLLDSLRSRRIILSTVASFNQYGTLLDLHPVQRLVIDEASQLLEPQLIGLLTRFRTAVLIGDHQQLPAVVAQSGETSRVADPALQSIGLTSLGDSYFERLYRRCLALNRTDHIGQLSQQGRMHELLMAFPNAFFYQNKLRVLEKDAADGQRAPIPEPPEDSLLPPPPSCVILPSGRLPLHQRAMFIPATLDEASPGYKTSLNEALIIVWLVQYFARWYQARGLPWVPGRSLGIITPWRAQIAQIRQVIEESSLNPEDYTIDTVERYQGGAREIILMSCCVQVPFQMQSLVSLSSDGVDRKLNVALTRARSFLVVTGVEAMLQEDPRYRAFIQRYRVG